MSADVKMDAKRSGEKKEGEGIILKKQNCGMGGGEGGGVKNVGYVGVRKKSEAWRWLTGGGRRGLQVMAKNWLGGTNFTQRTLAREKPRRILWIGDKWRKGG